MKIRFLIITLLAMILSIPAHAVLKEKDLGQTLSILRHELEKTHDEMGDQQQRMMVVSERMRTRLINTMSNANQNALMLYSQKHDYVFDLTYACHEATDQYREFKENALPFREFVDKANAEVARYDSLIQSLTTMPVMMLDERAKVDRNVCLTLAVNIRRMVKENQESLQDFMHYYNMSETRLKTLNDYAQKRYNDLQNSIFINGGDNYPMILKNLPQNLMETRQTMVEKYVSHRNSGSQWDSSVIGFLFVVIVFYGIIAVILNQLIMRLAVTRLMKRGMFNEHIQEVYFNKRACIIMASTVVTFAIILNVLRLVMQQNFLLMASDLLTEFAWLMSVILISILIRVESSRTMRTFFIYAPLLFMGFIVIAFRIVLIPNKLVNLILPAILLVCMLWQWHVMHKYRKEVQKSDAAYAIISQVVFITSVICSWIGYTLLSVQLLIWWIMQLTCILSITCLRDWYTKYAESHNISSRPITETWYYYFFTKVITPAAGVASFLYSIYWAAEVFNLTDMTLRVFNTRFIDSENFTLSISSISIVVVLWFIFNYINFTAKEMIRHYFYKIDPTTADSRSIMIINVIQVVIYGVWFLIALSICHVSNQWLVVISGGLSTGVGFASKDILENIYYGISLMAGRIKIGDWIVCDGTRGKVQSISYTSTMIEALDGSIIAFQNSQLFTKNYKNLTRNHGLELSVNVVGVAYGTKIQLVRKVIIETLQQNPYIQKKGEGDINVIVQELADSAVNLKVLCWIEAAAAGKANGQILEDIYSALNDNNIEIPFPQQDVHLINA